VEPCCACEALEDRVSYVDRRDEKLQWQRKNFVQESLEGS
jgi:hypothetical protein